MMMKGKLFLLITLASLFIAGCSDDPIKKLSDDKLDNSMTTAFWESQKNEHPKTWSQAVEYCQANKIKPNCQNVLTLYMIENGATIAPAIGHSGNALTVTVPHN